MLGYLYAVTMQLQRVGDEGKEVCVLPGSSVFLQCIIRTQQDKENKGTDNFVISLLFIFVVISEAIRSESNKEVSLLYIK